MSNTSLVIVESPTKAKTIRKFLSSDFEVLACVGHIRDLPDSAASIPKKYKEFEWAKLGVNVEDNFSPLYVLSKGKSKIIQEIKQALKNKKTLYLATDEDREGESISWHLSEVLKPKITTKRMVFHEITKSAIQNSLKNSRELDMNLVRAQEARRILDRLYGYTLSPLLWKKISFGLSAGRVQSTGLRLIVERERERQKFVPALFSDIKAELVKQNSEQNKKMLASLIEYQGKRIASGSDFDAHTGKLKIDKKSSNYVLSVKEAEKLCAKLKKGSWEIKKVDEKPSTSNVPSPYITSTLQQDGNRKLNLSTRQTMMLAQKLYEEGLITYMRTDSPNLSKEALSAAKKSILKNFGKEYLADKPRQFSAKNQSAQEAHEAIRPAGDEWLNPEKTKLSGKDLDLYQLIWQRTLASQMAPAKKSTTTLTVCNQEATFTISGTQIIFLGYLKVYKDAQSSKQLILPKCQVGEELNAKEVRIEEHSTKPIARYNEASLVQTLEKEGIGRPSTYSAIIGTILERQYATRRQNTLVPSFTGIAVIQLLEKNFSKLINYKFTSQMEDSLDEVANGNTVWTHFLKEFYLGKNGLKNQVLVQEKKIKAEESRKINSYELGDNIEVKVGKYGAYIVAEIEKEDGKKEKIHTSIPEGIAPAELTPKKTLEFIRNAQEGPESLGKDPESGKDIYCLMGRYGAYLQLGEAVDKEEKPKRQPLPRGSTPQNITLELAIKALSMPRNLGSFPKGSGKVIIVKQGRFGPYLEYDGQSYALGKNHDPYLIEFSEATQWIEEKKDKATKSNKIIKELENTPSKNKKTKIIIGRFGPYLKIGLKNYKIPANFLKSKDYEKELSLWEKPQIDEIIKLSKK